MLFFLIVLVSADIMPYKPVELNRTMIELEYRILQKTVKRSSHKARAEKVARGLISAANVALDVVDTVLDEINRPVRRRPRNNNF